MDGGGSNSGIGLDLSRHLCAGAVVLGEVSMGIYWCRFGM